MNKRTAGILLPIFSLPSNEGRGCFDENAYKYVDWLKKTKQSFWQILPLGPTLKYGNPYSAYSSFGGDLNLISTAQLKNDGFISNNLKLKRSDSYTYNQIKQKKIGLLKIAFKNFNQKDRDFNLFIEKNSSWLKPLAHFEVLTRKYGKLWNKWPSEFQDYKKVAKAPSTQDEYFIYFIQWVFYKQWQKLKKYANKNNIKILGDVPIYVDFHSVDVWTAPKMFKFDQKQNPKFVSGAPPDQFSSKGQVWNTPVFNWHNLEKDSFKWWLKRFKYIFTLYDITRIDHFRGLQAYWEIPNDSPPDARKGKWQKAMGRKLFTKLKQDIKNLPVVVEDLGDIDQDVLSLRDDFKFSGMNVLHFAFSSDSRNVYLPENHKKNALVYTGTHDNDTTKGWFAQLNEKEKLNLFTFFNIKNGNNIHWDLISIAHHSPSNCSIIPMQDILGLGSEGRINVPGTVMNNWKWQFQWNKLTPSMSSKLLNITKASKR